MISFFYKEITAVCPVHKAGKYRVVLDSDESQYGGTGSAKLRGVELSTKTLDEVEENDAWERPKFNNFA